MKATKSPKASGIQRFSTSSAATRRKNEFQDPPALNRIPLQTFANSSPQPQPKPQAPLLNLVLDPDEHVSVSKLADTYDDESEINSTSSDVPSPQREKENTHDASQVDLEKLNDSTLKVLDSILETDIQLQLTSPSSSKSSRASKDDMSSISLMDDGSDEEGESNDGSYVKSPRRSHSIASSESDLVSYGTESTITFVDGSGKRHADHVEEDEYSYLVSDGEGRVDDDDNLASSVHHKYGRISGFGNVKHRMMSGKSESDDESLSEILDSGSSYCETENNRSVSMVLESFFFSEGVDVDISHDDNDQEFAYEKKMAMLEIERGERSVNTDGHGGGTSNTEMKADHTNNLDVASNNPIKVNPLSNRTLEEIFARGGEAALDRALRVHDTPNTSSTGTSVHASPGLRHEDLCASLKSALMEIASLKEEKRWFESSLEARVEKSIEMSCSLDDANDLIRSMRRNEKELDTEMGKLKSELEKKNSERANLMKELSQNKGEVSNIKEVLAETKVELLQSSRKNEDLVKLVDTLTYDLSMERLRSQRAEVELNKVQGQLSGDKNSIEELEEENEILKEDIAIMQDEARETQMQIVSMKNELEMTKSILESLGKRVKTDDEELKNVRIDLRKAQNQILELKKEHNELCAEKDSSLTSLQSKLHQGQSELHSLKAKYQCSEKISEAVGQSLNEANERIISMEKELENAKNVYNQEVEKLRTAIVQKDAEVVNLQFEISQYTRQRNKMEREILCLKKATEAANSKHQAIESELKKEKNSIEEKNTEILEMQQRLEKSNHECANIGRSLNQASEQEQVSVVLIDFSVIYHTYSRWLFLPESSHNQPKRANEMIHQLRLELEESRKTQNEALLFIRNPCPSNRAKRDKENNCCFFPFGRKKAIHITTSSSQEAYETLIDCMENALMNHANAVGLSQATIDVLLQYSEDDHYQDCDIDFEGGLAYEVNNGEIQMLNSAPLRPSFKELSRRMIFFYRESCMDDDQALSVPQPIRDTQSLRLIQNEISTSNCVEWLQGVGDGGIRYLLGWHGEPGYVAPELESLVSIEEGETNIVSGEENTDLNAEESVPLLTASDS